MATTNSIKVNFKKVRETKGALVFVEVTADGTEVESDEAGKVIGSLYLRKKNVAGSPNALVVSIEVK